MNDESMTFSLSRIASTLAIPTFASRERARPRPLNATASRYWSDRRSSHGTLRSFVKGESTGAPTDIPNVRPAA